MIGFGSFGSVYKGKIKGVNVAIKVVSQNVHDTNNLKNFLKELDVISGINYERFLKLLGICLDPNSPFCIITDLMNLSLFDLLYSQQNEPINYFKKLDIALQLAEGIQYLHQNKIIHRDLKPENILLDKHHNIKICDFGMSRFIGEHQNSAYFTSQMMGTSNYMAPEYFRSSGIGTAVDI